MDVMWQLIDALHAEDVQSVVSKLGQLHPEELALVMAEFRARPDSRFSDNVLVALSLVARP